ncbi:MAG: methyltransferase domain-containing protein [Candidatus Woesearchaeota archaeon]|jgi:tRNA (adenine57-N1/adenine58-N1)-methyltransferase|nr:methyltransferase domain-containing protein [Candidatus Woesearchaeota archaeon]
MKVLISKKTGNYYYYTQENGDFHCKEGFIKEEDIKSGNSRALTQTNREFMIFEANGYDLTKKYKRGPQLIMAKDLGYILSRSGINKNSTVVEAGAGSGAATCFFAKFTKKVLSYEIREEHCKIVEKNIKFTGVDNVELVNKDLAEEIENIKEYDLLFLDMPEPVSVLEKELSGLKSGQYVVCYVPSISQIQEITKSISQINTLYLEEISEVMLRHWRVWERVARPEHQKEIDHTAFLVFIRKV